MFDISETLALFMDLQILGDRNLKKLAFSHVVHSIRRMNKKHKNDAKNHVLQNILFEILVFSTLLVCLWVCSSDVLWILLPL